MADGENPGLGVVLGAAGACPEIPFGGKLYKVGHPTQAAKTRLEKMVATAALNKVRELKEFLEPLAYQEAFGEAVKSLGDYKTWRPGWQKVVFDPANAHYYLWSLLREDYPDISETTVLKMFEAVPEEVAAALAQVLPLFFQMLLAEVADRLPPEDLAKAAATLAELRGRLTPTPPSTAT